MLSRGNEGLRIVADDKDRKAFLEILGRVAARFEGWYKNCEIGEAFGPGYSVVSRRVGGTKDGI